MKQMMRKEKGVEGEIKRQIIGNVAGEFIAKIYISVYIQICIFDDKKVV